MRICITNEFNYIQISWDILNKIFITKISFRAGVNRNRFLFRHFISYASRDRKRQKNLLYNCCFWYCQSVFIINNVLCDNWNIYHVCIFYGFDSLNHLFAQLDASFLLPVPDGFPLKKCRWLLCVCENFCMWIIVKKKKFHPRSTSSVFFLSYWFLLTFCFLFESLISKPSFLLLLLTTHTPRYFNELHLFFMLSFIHFFILKI